ncbi:DUF305 domain-containing protein [Pseudonocardia sp. KRD291]|uniref:DUF305 domain-containing protein n=1 Tax=Pseudonocardia sp. KRD291 TaxID=2792007 RepID=UPI001C4A0CAA|nr:DUF305 domain-containing protein [Pseudonocardia sp. KRD291]MBW0102963.1 DUF305 domain-containing protein [Pseudonocardia sp. KRD291]
MKRKSLLGVLATAAAALTLTACGGSGAPATSAPANPAAPTPPAAVSAAHNDADISFVQGMIPHHTQAVDMAKQATGQAGSEQVKALAARIEQAQGPEIAQMRGFLAAWGAPENAGGDIPGMDHSQSGMSGMMTDAQMQQLGQARGAAFDKMFLQMMIQHHQGAVQMARTELTSGQNPQAKTLAQTIIDAQQSEIAEMQQLLTSA